MPPFIPRIYPITDRKLSGLSHAEQVRALVEGGASFIQIREKEMSGGAFFEDAKRAMEIAHAAGARILINDRVDIAIVVGADGVHLGQNDLPPVEARKLLGAKAIIGYSTHNIDQAKQASYLPIDYLAIGPVFTTSTKPNADPVVGLEGVQAVRNLANNLSIVAIGGINETNMAAVFEAGADSAAMIGAVLGNGSNIREVMRVLNTI
ncbi:MAG TPA: thiamine phosphate synthase [Pyrinomonadaceae bacterium]|nr:thiamine phosphate synthase [Pyrinomonadaceae bacterium]